MEDLNVNQHTTDCIPVPEIRKFLNWPNFITCQKSVMGENFSGKLYVLWKLEIPNGLSGTDLNTVLINLKDRCLIAQC